MEQSYNLFVAIIGKPNVGKSSLLNELLGEKVAIVSEKPQTTRTRITGILTEDAYQYVFLDTPGFHQAKTKLSEHMVKAVHSSVSDVDVALFLVEPFGQPAKAELALIENLKLKKIPAILVINKIDLLRQKAQVAEQITQYMELYPFEAVLPISILEKDGTELVLQELRQFAEPGPHFFPDDALTDQPEKVIVAEIIREKMLRYLHQEIPHGTAVIVEEMKERESGIIDIQAQIYCEKSSHKGMIIGKKGTMLKKIASEARQDIERFLHAKINLQCWVKIRDDWRNKENLLYQLGFRDQN